MPVGVRNGVRLLALGWLVVLLVVVTACGGGSAGSDAGLDGRADGSGGDGGPADGPLDSDSDGIPDEVEDTNGNGQVDPGETDPHDPDSDADGLPDGIEDGNHNGRVDWAESDPLDPDSDDDGILDGTEDQDGDGQLDPGESDPLRADSDRDGLPDGLEDSNRNGRRDPGETDPTSADSDGDGLTDGQEDANQNGQVDADETDPRNPDMDGDGLADGDEDRDGDGRLGTCQTACQQDGDCRAGEVCTQRLRVCYSATCSQGESDPFLVDTDGDGIDDAHEASSAACSAAELKPVQLPLSEPAELRLALEEFFAEVSRLSAGGQEVGLMFASGAYGLAGFAISRPQAAADVVAQEGLDRAALASVGTLATASTRSLVSFDGYPVVLGEYELAVTPRSSEQLAGELAQAWYGQTLTGLLPDGPTSSSAFLVRAEILSRGGQQGLALAVVSPVELADEAQLLRLGDVANGTALAGHTDQTEVACDTFVTPGADRVDFIWVVDNSESMAEEQSAVAAAGQAMAGLLANTTIDWRIAITKTDAVYDGLLWSSFTRDIERFRADVVLGTDGSPLERTLDMGLRALDHALAGGCTPEGAPEDRYRLRCGATPVVVFLTDEDDETIEENSGGENYSGEPDAATVAGYVSAYRDRGAVLFAISGGNPRCPTALNASKGIDAVVHGVGGGAVGSICDLDQSANVEKIVRVASGVSSTYQLSHPAISATLKVAAVFEPGLGPEQVPRSRSQGFDYDAVANTVVFYGMWRPQQAGRDLAVSYRYFVACRPSDEECDGRDNDCDGLTDEDFDADSDGWSACGGDCDESRPDVNPDAPEVCDGADNDCDGTTDEGFDNDGDGFRTCDGDCDDDNELVFPGAPELCDGLDNDCDEMVDPEWACG